MSDGTTLRPPTVPAERFRPDIQAMRALAALAVLGFHLWPEHLPGGFDGVDVFFVISGFLIVGNLAREVRETGRIRLGQFWARRARRILPIALTVLAAVAVTVLVLVPMSLWQHFLRDVIASTFYIENWVLAADTTDYFAQNNGPSPLEHFWTLSLEEQFYVAIPIVMVLSLLLVRRRPGLNVRAIAIALVAVTAVTFGLSLWSTTQDTRMAFFGITTRAWEFGLGALLCFLPTLRNRKVGSLLFAAGLVAVVVSTLVLVGPHFNAWFALWPVLAACAMVVGGAALSAPLKSLVGIPSVQLLGRISYATYLWHFPLIVLVPIVLDRPLGNTLKVGIVIVTLGLAWLSTRFIEEPIRLSAGLLGRARPRVIAAWSAAGMALVVLIAGAGLFVVHQRTVDTAAAIADSLADDASCFGAAAIAHDCTPPAGPILPDPATAASDDGNLAGCWSELEESTFRLCSFGASSSKVHLLVVGDSHSSQYAAAYERVAAAAGWRIDLAGHNGCYWTAAVQSKPTQHEVDACEAWKVKLRAHLAAATPYTAIIVTNQQFGLLPQPQGAADLWDLARDGMVDEWQTQIARGSRIIVVKDDPRLQPQILVCVARHPDTADRDCATTKDVAFAPRDPLVEAATATTSSVIDFTDIYCPGWCWPVIGGVMVYRDQDHLTRTWVLTLAPFLRERIAAALATAPPS